MNSRIYTETITDPDRTFNEVNLELELKRNPKLFVWNIVLPSVLMSVVTLFVFMLPPDAGEKIGLGITVLLGYTFVLLMVSDITPRTAENMPALSKNRHYKVYACGGHRPTKHIGPLTLYIQVIVLKPSTLSFVHQFSPVHKKHR